MRVAIAGSSGLIGRAVSSKLTAGNHSVTRIVRPYSDFSKEENVVLWDPSSGLINREALEDHDAVLNFAGENIASGRWTGTKRRRIWSSRVDGTLLLSNALARVKKKPKVFISASATGFYGNRDSSERLDEFSNRGRSFRSDLCHEWEKATLPAQKAGIRVVLLRIGIVLSKTGGSLKRMLPFFKWGLGGRFGDGKQILSWVALEDIPSIVKHIVSRDKLSGPVNAVSPHPVSNEAFTNMLGSVLKRPVFLKIPGFLLKLIYGQMAKELLLEGAFVEPKVLIESGYRFVYPALEKFFLKAFDA